MKDSNCLMGDASFIWRNVQMVNSCSKTMRELDRIAVNAPRTANTALMRTHALSATLQWPKWIEMGTASATPMRAGVVTMVRASAMALCMLTLPPV